MDFDVSKALARNESFDILKADVGSCEIKLDHELTTQDKTAQHHKHVGEPVCGLGPQLRKNLFSILKFAHIDQYCGFDEKSK